MKKPKKIRQRGRYWSIKCCDGVAHGSFLFLDTEDGIVAVTKALIQLDLEPMRNCGPHKILELVEKD